MRARGERRNPARNTSPKRKRGFILARSVSEDLPSLSEETQSSRSRGRSSLTLRVKMTLFLVEFVEVLEQARVGNPSRPPAFFVDAAVHVVHDLLQVGLPVF